MTFTKAQKIFIGITIIAVIGVSVGGCQKQPEEYTGPVEKITVGVGCPELSVSIWVAEEQGYFTDNGLDVTIEQFLSGVSNVKALLAGKIDISSAAEFVFVTESFEHENLRVLGVVATADRIDVIARKDHGIAQISDLKGKKIGVTCSSQGEFFLGTFLVFNNLSFEEVEVVDLKPTELVEAISNGDIDAAITWASCVYPIVDNLRENAIMWPGQGRQDFYWLAIGTQELVNAKPAAIERFLKSVVQAEEFVVTNAAEARDIVIAHTGAEEAYLSFTWPKQRYAVSLPQELIIAMEDQARWRIKQGLTNATEVPNYLHYIYMDALEEVKPEAVRIIR